MASNPSASTISRRRFLQMSGIGLTTAALGRHLPAAETGRHPMNILFLTVDDLRPQLACYGIDWMKTPNIDRLAAGGTLFERAYSQYPICGPSRASIHSGLRPTATRFSKWNARIDEDTPDVLTLPGHFLNNGYATQCLGKVFHEIEDCKQVWSEGAWIPPKVLGASLNSYNLPDNRSLSESGQHGPPFESAPVEDTAYGDGKIASRACEALQRLGQGEKPFFLAVGFLRPHLPFTAPARYWEGYSREALPLAKNPKPPLNVPDNALHNWEELRKYAGMPKEGPLDEETARTLVHGYCASVSYLDSQVGRVLDELDKLGLRENTLIIFSADHGWQLGEHGLWAKHCLFEQSLQCPLIFSGPGVAIGRRVTGLVEYLDVYPTLCEAAGLPVPPHVQGHSLRPILKDPDAPGKEAVFSRHGKSDSVKTDHHRYSEWRDDSGKVVARMLYDHQSDPAENKNIAEDPAASEVVAVLSRRLAEHLASI